jgi:hypothetical protein
MLRTGAHCAPIPSCKEAIVQLRLDKFTVAVLVVVGLLLVAAVITVNRAGSAPTQEYRSDDAPETPVVNAFLALQQGDLATARRQYSQAVLARADEDKSYGPLSGQTYYMGDSSRRLRLIETRLDPDDSDRAYVTVAIDNYNTGGVFNSGSTWTNERVVEVVREEGAWKINIDEFFY